MNKKCLFLILFLFFILPIVNANESNVTSDNLTVDNHDDSLNSIDVDCNNDSDINNDNENILQASSYQNSSSTSKSIQKVSKILAKDVTTTYSKKTKFSVTVKDKHGKIIKKQKVKFKVSKKSYTKFTNSKGVATIYLKLNAGNYIIHYSSGKITGKKKFIVKNYYTIGLYRWNSGADITRNKVIRDNIPNSELVKKMVRYARSGTPVIKFKGGNGKVVFISAGVHGNELSSQVAAMRAIQYLETHPIKGTVYIMPFMNPKATASNVRDYGVALNSKANVKGTISYNTVCLILKFKCDAYGDFHCTQPRGEPGRNAVMGTYTPTVESATIAKYIAQKSNVKYIIYKMAGAEYPGAMEDVVSLKGIPAVTCEVLTHHGTIAYGSVSKSLSMMSSFLKYNSIF